MNINYKELAEAYGWNSVPSKLGHMISFVKETIRMNIYITTGTITFQREGYMCDTYRNVDSDIEFEKVLLNKNESISPSI